ncbi:hypothetical protein BKA62DRAFT_688199 [Auriculariales sp. MPI-PUGE-AT-0066]|nr:hypothetical protein BKA62DRAFT_688199 [Auriculariales sp. MPI-PUGE-AT-0066]
MMSSAAATKERLYGSLTAKLAKFSSELRRNESSMARMKNDVVAMQTLAGLHGAQFMAAQRIVDIEFERQDVQRGRRSGVVTPQQ